MVSPVNHLDAWYRHALIEPPSIGLSLFLGAERGLPLLPLDAYKMAKHTKGDKDVVKKERPNRRIVRMSQLRDIGDIPALFAALFGASVVDSPCARAAEASFASKE